MEEAAPKCCGETDSAVVVTKETNDFCTKQKTLTEIGHNFIPPANERKQVLTFKIPEELREVSVPMKEVAFKTTYNEDMDWHYNINDPVDRANRLCGRFHYIKPYAEQIIKNPPKPHRAPLSEYQDKYPPAELYPPKSKVVNLKPIHFCKIQDSSKVQQPPLRTDSEGYLKHLDIYISTSHFDYHQFYPRDLEQYKDKPFPSEDILTTRIKPVYDNSVFKQKYYEKILPKTSRPVPHSGMESEMKSKYRLPVDEMSCIKIKIPAKMPSLSKPTKAEILSTPAMYHTEYSHIGTNWHLAAVINRTKEEK